MKTKLYLLFFFVFPLFMSACRGDDPIPDPPVDGKRTVLVYMAADNSINPLASFTDGDLEELKAVGWLQLIIHLICIYWCI